MGTELESFAATLNEEDRQLLQSSVAFVLRIVASADSVVDKKEVSALARANDLARERFGAAFSGPSAELPEALAAAKSNDWPQSPYVRKVAAIVKKLPEGARKLYDRSILELALTVADASGGGILGFGQKLSADEKYAIRRVVSALGVTIEDATARTSLGF